MPDKSSAAGGVFKRLQLGALILLIACGMAGGCGRQASLSPPEPFVVEEEPITAETALEEVALEDLPLLFDDGDRESLKAAIRSSRRWLAARPADHTMVFSPRIVSAREMVEGLDKILGWIDADLSPETLAAEIVNAFDVLESVGDRSAPEEGEIARPMLITGYYVPVIEGSLRRSRDYQVPIYRPPGDLIRVDLGLFSDRWKGQRTAGRLQGNRLVPYPDRKEIRETGTLRGREIAWAKDRVDLFFVEIQGSGVLRLPNGRERRFGYAGANGRQYRSIGKMLIDEGKIEREKVSMQSIRAYLDEHPEDVERVLDFNTSMVFFRWLEGEPVGSLGFPVIPGRSVATDHKLFPPAALGFLVTDVPALAEDGRTVAEGPLVRFVLNHDRGGAIKGAHRADFFWGRGADAAARAGAMKQPGRLFFLVPKDPNAALEKAQAKG